MMTSTEFKIKILPLSRRIYPMLARMLNDEEEAKDAVQEIMIKLWDKKKNLDKHPNILGHVYLTARNYCIDLLRHKKRDIVDTMNQNLIADYYVEEGQNELEGVFVIILQIIDALPEKQREIILMKDIDGFKFDEIVAVTGLKVEHIRVLLSRARKQVRMQLEENYNYEKGRYK